MLRLRFFGIAAVSLGILAAAPAGSFRAEQSPDIPTVPPIRVQSSLVLVDVISQDPKSGLPVRDFGKSDFRLFNDGHEVSIATFDAGARFDTRPVIVWLAVICNERGKIGGSAEYAGKEGLFRPALDHLDRNDRVGVAHWCDDGEATLDLPPTEDRDKPLRVLADTIKPISFEAGSRHANDVGEAAFRKMVRLIIRDARQRNPQPLPVIVFIDGDYTGQWPGELDDVVNDFLETSGIVFGVKDHLYPEVPPWLHNGQRGAILHYMAEQTGGEYFTVPPSAYSTALEMILLQLHFRYQLGFIPAAIDGKRHSIKVELAKRAREERKGVRLRYRREYIPARESPDWAR